MNYYTKQQTDDLFNHQFAFIEVKQNDHILEVTLAREKKKNALHPHMVNEMAFAFQYAHLDPSVWAVLLQAKGDVFCAGADLKAMAGMAEPHESTIPFPEKPVLIGDLFNKIYKPVIAKVEGNVYAGGMLLVAGATIVVAQEGVKFGLPEVKRGLYPFQVMAALLQVMPPRKVIDWCIRGYHLDVRQAEYYGLINQIAEADRVDAVVNHILEELKGNSPSAIRLGLEAYDHIHPTTQQHEYLLSMLQKTIMTKDAQEGLKAFREKRPPVWTGE